MGFIFMIIAFICCWAIQSATYLEQKCGNYSQVFSAIERAKQMNAALELRCWPKEEVRND